jgi:DNA-binding NtrC family response regulator
MLALGETTVEHGASPAAALTALYVIVHAPDGMQAITLADGDELVVGRGEDAAIRVGGPEVSRAHAVIRRRGAAVEIADLGSRNGTWLDGARLDRAARLVPGTFAHVGEARLGLAVCAETTSPAAAPRDDDPRPVAPAPLVVADPAMRQLYADARRVARASCSVLVTGETGAGKELVAEHLHQASARARGPFVRLSCAAIPETLLEGELFGHERGAFTGADRRRAGWFEAAHGGTLFLDEIGELTPGTQAKLLRALESGRITRLGATDEVAVDVRVVCATHRDLAAAVQAGTFRADLYFRIASVILTVPPLRERPGEIALLAARFAQTAAARAGVPAPVIDPSAAALLLRHLWPGNVRELRNAIERAVALCRGDRITALDLPDTVRAADRAPTAPSMMRAHVDRAEREAIVAALAAEGGNQTRAAQRLGISRRNLVYKLTKYGLR